MARPSDQALVASPSNPQAVSTEGFDPSRERPSQHGKYLGEALADMAKAGAVGTDLLVGMCATCAFREGCMTNQMAATGKDALNIVMGIDTAEFGCHHGLKNGEPTRRCVGAIAALRAPWEVKRAAVFTLSQRLDSLDSLDQRDPVREAFDAWADRADPDRKMDDYQRARAYAIAIEARSDATGTGAAEGESAAIAQKEQPHD